MLLWWVAVWTATFVTPPTGVVGTIAPELGLQDGAIANPSGVSLGVASGGTFGT